MITSEEYLSGNLSSGSGESLSGDVGGGSDYSFSGRVNGDLIFGVPGTTFVPSVSEETGEISWTNDGGLENPPPVNLREPVERFVAEYLEENGTDIPVATDEILGGIKLGENLKGTEDGTVSVDTTGEVTETDLRPITSQAVYSEFGKIVALLNTI